MLRRSDLLQKTFRAYLALMIILSIGSSMSEFLDSIVVSALCFQTISLVSCLLVGIVSCVQPIASTLFGERDFEGLRIVMRSASKYLAISMLAFFFLCELFPVVLTSLYSIFDPALMAMTFHAIRIFSFVHLLRTFVVLFMYYYLVTDHEDVGTALSTEDSFGVLAEEMTEYTIEYAEKDTLIDVLVRIEDEHITMCFRSSGAPLSALNAVEDPDASLVFTSGQMLHRLASELEYKRILGLNSTLIALNR